MMKSPASRAAALKSLAMPKPQAQQDSEDDLSMLDEGSPEEEASESPDEAKAEGDEPSEDSAPLSDFSDEDLIKELRARGLIEEDEESKLEAEAGKQPASGK